MGRAPPPPRFRICGFYRTSTIMKMDLHILKRLGSAIFGSAYSKGVSSEGVVIPTGIVTYSYPMSRDFLAYCQPAIEMSACFAHSKSLGGNQRRPGVRWRLIAGPAT